MQGALRADSLARHLRRIVRGKINHLSIAKMPSEDNTISGRAVFSAIRYARALNKALSI
jgi:hypothetical protein